MSGVYVLDGEWDVEIKDKIRTRYSTVSISQYRNKISMYGKNFSENVEDIHSTWSSELCHLTETKQFTYVYKKRAKNGSYMEGISVLNLEGIGKFPQIMTGHYYDSGDSQSSGTLTYTRKT